MEPAVIIGEAGLIALGAYGIAAAHNVARSAVAVAREALEKNWVRASVSVTPPDGRYLKPPPKAAEAAAPDSAAGPVPITGDRSGRAA